MVTRHKMNISAVFLVMALPLIAASKCRTSNGTSECQKTLDSNKLLIVAGQCPAGFVKKCMCPENKKNFICTRCGDGTYMTTPNTLTECFPCKFCDVKVNKIIISKCTPEKDQECGCDKGRYKKTYFTNDFICEDCAKCTNCSTCLECNNMCKEQCEHGQYLDKGKCQSCVNNFCADKACKSFCEKGSNELWKQGLVIILPILLLLLFAAIIVCCTCTKRKLCVWVHETQKDNQTPVQPSGHVNIQMPVNINVQPDPDPESTQTQKLLIPGCQLPHTTNGLHRYETPKDTWPAHVLYTIIGEVPVRRWKEFLRLLSVSDDQMDRVQMEAGPSYREQQYQMLRLWSQRSGVDLEDIYSTLHCMDLSGCAQELREKLQQLEEAQKVDTDMA